MQQDGANGMTYWQFMRKRIGTIRDLSVKCQQLYFTSYSIVVPIRAELYTSPESFVARHTQPHPNIPEDVKLSGAPATWWSLVEIVSWDAWVIPHVPQIMPECNIPMLGH